MSRLSQTLPVAVIGLLLTTPVAAEAVRQPTATERRAVERAAGLPRNCGVVEISTVDRRWASVGVNLAPKRCRKYDRGRLDVAERANGRWRIIRAQRACVRPRGVPTKVWNDFSSSSCGEL